MGSAERLKQGGLRVWLDEWVIQPGANFSSPRRRASIDRGAVIRAFSTS